jgi:hypothetical protein
MICSSLARPSEEPQWLLLCQKPLPSECRNLSLHVSLQTWHGGGIGGLVVEGECRGLAGWDDGESLDELGAFATAEDAVDARKNTSCR